MLVTAADGDGRDDHRRHAAYGSHTPEDLANNKVLAHPGQRALEGDEPRRSAFTNRVRRANWTQISPPPSASRFDLARPSTAVSDELDYQKQERSANCSATWRNTVVNAPRRRHPRRQPRAADDEWVSSLADLQRLSRPAVGGFPTTPT